MNKPKLIVMCGLQCSGKSTRAVDLFNQMMRGAEDAVILSSDELRKNFKNITNSEVFTRLYFDMNLYLRQGTNVILDCTNTTIKMRQQLFSNIKEDCTKICHIMNTPIQECKERLEKRNNSYYPIKVPMEVLDKYYKSFEIPFYEEGWDSIHVDRYFSREESNQYLEKIKTLAKDFNQQNKHHTQNLLEHMNTTAKQVAKQVKDLPNITEEQKTILIQAAQYHDIGKLYTQTFKEGDENAHYYNHANVGAYEMLSHWSDYTGYITSIEDCTLLEVGGEVIFFINYHMILHNEMKESTLLKYKKLFGNKLFKYLEILYEADKYRE